jgi:hypothetical protein
MSSTKEYIRRLERYIKERSSQAQTVIYERPYPMVDRLQAPTQGKEVDDFINRRRKEAFREMLFEFIDRSGLADAEIYRKAGLDRRHFSKIRSHTDYRPQKSTVIALILALELDIGDASDLLETGGYSLSCSNTFDLIIQFCLENRIYDFFVVNELLDHYQQKALGQDRC